MRRALTLRKCIFIDLQHLQVTIRFAAFDFLTLKQAVILVTLYR